MVELGVMTHACSPNMGGRGRLVFKASSRTFLHIEILSYWTGEVAQWLNTLAAFGEDTGSIPSTYMLIHNQL